MKPDPVADALWLATLACLPLVGVGLIRTLTGHDLGAGLQPAYATLAAAWVWRLGGLATVRGRESLGAVIAPSRQPAVWLALVAVVGVVAVSAVGLRVAPAPVVPAEAWPRYVKQVIQLLVMLAFTIHAWLWTRGADRWRATGRWLAVGLAAQIGYALLQTWHLAGGLPWFAVCERVATSNPAILSGSEHLYLGGFTGVPRLRGTMCEPLYLGSYLVAAIPLLAATGRRGWAVAGGVALLATWSRGAWLALLVALAAWLILRRRAGLPGPGRRWWLGGAAGLVLASVLVLVLAGPDALALPLRRLGQTLDLADWSNLTRAYSVQAAWRAFQQSPLVGVGWGQFAYHFYALVDVTGLHSQFQWPVVNSMPLVILCETGLVGAAVTAVLGVVGIRATWRALAVGDCVRRARLAAAAAAVAGTAAHYVVFSQYNLPHPWVALGLWLAALGDAGRHAEDPGEVSA